MVGPFRGNKQRFEISKMSDERERTQVDINMTYHGDIDHAMMDKERPDLAAGMIVYRV